MGTGGAEDRLGLRLTRDTFTVNYNLNFIGEHGEAEINDFDSYMTHDITVEYRTAFNLDVTAGVVNLPMRPVIDP